MSQSVPGIPRDPLIGPVPGSLHRRRALVKGMSRGASPVTTRRPIQIRARPPVETKESSHLVNRLKGNSQLVQLIIYPLPSYIFFRRLCGRFTVLLLEDFYANCRIGRDVKDCLLYLRFEE